MATFARWWQSATDVVGASIGSPPRRASAASASSSVATGMISTPSPATRTARRRGSAPLRRRARGSGAARPGGRPTPSARSPPIAPTLPSRSIVPVTATLVPPSRSPGVSSSISVSVNASPARRAADLAGVDVDLEGQVHRPGVERVEADDRRARVRRVGDQLHVGGHGLGAVGLDAVDRDRDGVARLPVGEGRGHVGGGVDRRAVDLDERVAVLQVLDAGHELARSARRRPRRTAAARSAPGRAPPGRR